MSTRRQGATTTPLPLEQPDLWNKPDNKTCTTISGKGCVFPFVYKGTTYNTCTARDAEETWCPIILVGGWDSVYKWETCDLSRCLFYKDQLKSCATENHRACVFPFIYNNVKYWSCTLAGGRTDPWCATEVDTETDEYTTWATCSQGCPALQGNAQEGRTGRRRFRSRSQKMAWLKKMSLKRNIKTKRKHHPSY